MPFEIVRGNAANMRANMIVEPAGTESGRRLHAANKETDRPEEGRSIVTRAPGPDAMYVIHTSEPAWRGGSGGEEELLHRCYRGALGLAKEYGCGSIAFPLLCAGKNGFPKELALRAAVEEFSAFLAENEMLIILAVISDDIFRLSERLYSAVAQYIDENYARKKFFPNAYRPHLSTDAPAHHIKNGGYGGECCESCPELFEGSEEALPAAPYFAAAASLQEKADGTAPDWGAMLSHTDAGFSETLLRLIDRTGRKDSEIYKRANVDRKLFSKIRTNSGYTPSKTTAIAFALALELDIDETRDLISRAGYALSHSSKSDIIIEYFITHRNYDIFELNEVLFAFHQPCIGVRD